MKSCGVASRVLRPNYVRRALKAFKAGKIDVLVATDAFARGMDVVGVGNVINYDMPTFTKTYVHRTGRTARADQTGRCFTLMGKSQVKTFENMLKKVDNNSYSTYSLPAESLERLAPAYLSALEKLKDFVESKMKRKPGVHLHHNRSHQLKGN